MKLMMIGDMIFKLPARLKGYGIYYKMVMEIICVQVGGTTISYFLPHIRLAVSKPILCASSGVTSPV